MAGLRELKKQQTRDALILAAHELFVAQGYEATTVEEIASRVEVSERTFFRYFAVKEDVVFALQEEAHARFSELLRGRPDHEPPLVALRAALEEILENVAEAITEIVSMDLHIRMWQLMETTPSLLAAQLWRSIAMEEQLADVVAERAGVDVWTDPRPRTLVAVFFGVLRTAMQEWARSGDASLDGARARLCTFLDQIPSVFESDWAEPVRSPDVQV